jgi:hypothetical protein
MPWELYPCQVSATIEHTFAYQEGRDGQERSARREENPKSGWDVKASGAKRASANEKTQAAAEKTAKKIVGNAGGGEVVIHGRDGRIRDKDTVAPGNDPTPPKDKKHWIGAEAATSKRRGGFNW